MNHAQDNAWTLRLRSGLQMLLPPSLKSLSTHVLLEQERWFEPEITLLPMLLRPDSLALDIGANHGVYALEMARCAPQGHVWAFEPTAEPRGRLQASVAANAMQDRITVVPAGLAECDTEALFTVSEQSELNSRGGAAAPGARSEAVQLLALDAFLERHAAGRAIDFVKLDAEGEEPRVLQGGARFFAEQQPVVLFELKHGRQLNWPLLQQWTQMGYGLYRWSETLALLLPFDAQHDEMAFALNLVAVPPARAAELAARGLLVTPEAMRSAPDLRPGHAALQAWCALPAMAGVPLPDAAAFEADPGLQALAAVAAAHQRPDISGAERLHLLLAAHALASPDSPHPEDHALRVHVLQALGRQAAAVALARQLLAQWPAGRFDAAPARPAVPPELHDLVQAPRAALRPWLRQRLAEFAERRSAFSGIFQPPAPERWAALLADPDHSAEVERRYLLAHFLQDRVPPLAGLSLLPDAAHTANPSLWQGLIAAARAMAPPPAASQTTPEAVLARLGEPVLQVVDVGASSLGEETEPYAPLRRHARVQVTGFEPDAEALAKLRRQFPDEATHRYLPHFVGDGRPATFHETRWSLTASLLEPNRPVLDRYQHLGELVQEKARHAVQTVRLDDVIPAGGMDVLKIDVQGGEGRVFDGAGQRLRECLLVWTEVEFAPLYRGQPLFADIDAQLRAHGLQFLCFVGLAQRPLASWAAAGTGGRLPGRMQQLWADAIYVPTAERIAQLSADAALRLALIAHHMAGAHDLAHAALLRVDALRGTQAAADYASAMSVPAVVQAVAAQPAAAMA